MTLMKWIKKIYDDKADKDIVFVLNSIETRFQMWLILVATTTFPPLKTSERTIICCQGATD